MNFYFDLFKMKNKVFRQLFSFYSIGILNTLIDFTLYNLFIYIFNLNPNISKPFSYIVATINSFILNRSLTFKSKNKNIKVVLRFIILYLITIFINYESHKFFYEYYQNYIPFIGSTIISSLFNFLGQKFLVFTK